jgi:hypothetical protein
LNLLRKRCGDSAAVASSWRLQIIMTRSENFNHREPDRNILNDEARAASQKAFEDVSSVWGLPKKTLNNARSLSEGLIGVGEGFAQSVKESVDLSSLREGILQAAEAVKDVGQYAAKKIATGDVNGFVRDVQSIGESLKEAGREYSKLPPKEKGRIIGHDLMPLIIPNGFNAIKDAKLLRQASEVLAEVAEHNLPSEAMFKKLDEAYERLHPMEKEFLNRHDIKVTAVGRAINADLPGLTERTLGYYAHQSKTIGIASEVNSRGRWIPNEHVELTLKHEIGHAFNRLTDAERTGKLISERPAFVRAYNRDIRKLSDDVLQSLGLSRENPRRSGDEVFADLYAHASGVVTTDGATNKIKRCFPRCFEYVRGFNDVK